MRALLIILMIPVGCVAQLSEIGKTAKGIADAAELAAITVDIIESTSFTLEKTKACESELKQLEDLIKDPKIKKYLPDGKRRKWANDVRVVTMNVRLYSTLISSMLRKLGTIEKSLIAKNGEKLLNSISGAVSGGTSQSSAKVVDAMKDVEAGVEQATLQQTLISFLIKIDDFNTAVDQLMAETSRLSEGLGAELGFAILTSLPARSIRDFAAANKSKN